MPITLSEIIEDTAQADGRRHIRERHTDHIGAFHEVAYMAEAGADVTATMNGRVAQIVEQLKESEIESNMSMALDGISSGFSFVHSVVNDSLWALRGLFMDATKWELMTLAWVINDNGLSDNRLKRLFGVNDAGLVGLKTRLSNIAGKYTAALALAGE